MNSAARTGATRLGRMLLWMTLLAGIVVLQGCSTIRAKTAGGRLDPWENWNRKVFNFNEDVDKAVVAGLSHPMGPLKLSDLVGLDTLKLIADKLYEEFKEPHFGPPPLLLRMVEAGLLGKKSGQGFYKY